MGHYENILKTRRRINGVPMTSVGDAAVLFEEYEERKAAERRKEEIEYLSSISNLVNRESGATIVNIEILPDGSRKITIIEQ